MIDHGFYKKYSEYVGLGIEVAGAFVIPMLIGYKADQYFDTKPWCALGGALFGFIGVFWTLYKVAVTANQKNDSEKKE